MTDDMVTQTSGASSNPQLDVSVLVNLAGIINTSRSALSNLVKTYVNRNWSYGNVFYAFQHDLEEVLEEAVSAIEHLYISNPNNVQLREVDTMMSRGRRFPQSGRYSGRNQRRTTPGSEVTRNSSSTTRLNHDDEDTSDFETISSSATYIVDEDEEDSDDESSECSESDSDQYYYYSYLSLSDLASDGASIRSDDSFSDDDDDDDEEDFTDEELMDDELEDWTKPVRLAKTCHVLTENVVRNMLRNDYLPQWFDVVDLVLENEEQVSKGPAEPEFIGDARAIQDPAKDFSKLISKELLRNEQAQMISLVETAPESTRLEITATTLFAPSNDRSTDAASMDMD